MPAELNFDATTVVPATEFETLPAGVYLAQIVESEMKPTKKGDGELLELTLEVIDGEHRGTKLWDRLNLKNPSSEAVRIARSTLSSICHAVGVLKPRSSVELHNLPMEIKVACRKDEKSDKIYNDIKAYNKKSAPNQAPQAGGQPWKRS